MRNLDHPDIDLTLTSRKITINYGHSYRDGLSRWPPIPIFVHIWHNIGMGGHLDKAISIRMGYSIGYSTLTLEILITRFGA